ncbi:acetylcholinesterase-like [Oculina patagonica]
MKLLSSRVLCMFVTCAVLLYASNLTRAEIGDNQSPSVVQTESGAVVGKIETLPHGKSVHEYLGIPYAEPPVGELRFAAPKPVKPWSGIKRVTEFGAPCPQPSISYLGTEINFSRSGGNIEDCLFLNVFVPSSIKPDDKMAVMVWIHGGAFSYGTASDYPAGILATFNDVIVVTVNYRLGVLGFFNVPGTEFKGNYGMFDQVLALKWVQTNIASFGGDPNRVTIFGQSAGGMSVSLHLISPLSKGLFHRAIMQSGASSSPLYCGKVSNTEPLEQFVKRINCSLAPHLAECVRGKSVEDITKAKSGTTISKSMGSQNIVGPIVDGEFLPDLPEIMYKTGQFHPDVDVIAGVTSNEGALFAMIMPRYQVEYGVPQEMFESVVRNRMIYAREKNKLVEDLTLFEYTKHVDPNDTTAVRQLMMDCFSDTGFVAPAILEAEALAKGGRSPYVYVFDHRSMHSTMSDWIGVAHGMDMAYVFGAPFKNVPEPAVNALAKKYSETEKGLSLYIMKLWTDFAKYGSPNPPDSGSAELTWPKFTEGEREYLVLDLKPRVGRRYKADKVAFWNNIVPKVAEFTQTVRTENEKKAERDEL